MRALFVLGGNSENYCWRALDLWREKYGVDLQYIVVPDRRGVSYQAETWARDAKIPYVTVHAVHAEGVMLALVDATACQDGVALLHFGDTVYDTAFAARGAAIFPVRGILSIGADW